MKVRLNAAVFRGVSMNALCPLSIIVLTVSMWLAPAVHADNTASLDAFAQVNGTQILCAQDTTSLPKTSAMCSATGAGQAAGLSGTATSFASFGTLKMFATVSDQSADTGALLVQADGDAAAFDTLTVRRFHGEGFLTEKFKIDGTVTGEVEGEFFAHLFSIQTPTDRVSCILGIPLMGTTCTLSFPVVDGEQVGMDSALILIAENNEQAGVLSSTANFSDTASIISLSIDDASGARIPGATITAASGTAYPTSVPEPSSLFLIGMGLIALVGVKKLMDAEPPEKRRFKLCLPKTSTQSNAAPAIRPGTSY